MNKEMIILPTQHTRVCCNCGCGEKINGKRTARTPHHTTSQDLKTEVESTKYNSDTLRVINRDLNI